MVPREPTPEMLRVMHNVVALEGGYRNGLLQDIYKAMLAATPTQQQDKDKA